MPRKPNKINGKKPATQHDLSILAGHVTERFDRMEKKMATKADLAILDKRVDGLDKKVDGLDKKVDGLDKKVDGLDKKVDGLDKKFGRLERGQKAMLGILDENNQLLKETRRLPERVARLERSVFRR